MVEEILVTKISDTKTHQHKICPYLPKIYNTNNPGRGVIFVIESCITTI